MILEADREPHGPGPDARRTQCRIVQTEMGGGRRMDDERFGVTDIGEMREQPERLDELAARRSTAADLEGEDGAATFRQQSPGERVVRV